MSSQDESSRKAKPTRKKNKMAQKKAKKIKEPDLTPAKDAKGGRKRHHGHGFGSLLSEKEEPGRTPPGGGYGIHMLQ